MTTIMNNGKMATDEQSVGRAILLRFGGVEKTFIIGRNEWNVPTPITVSADCRIRVGWILEPWSDPCTPEEITELLAFLGFEFAYTYPVAEARANTNNLGWRAIMAIAGHGPEGEQKKWDRQPDGLVFLGITSGRERAYSLSEAERLAGWMLQDARRWIRQTFPSAARNWNLDDFTAVEFFRVARRADVTRLKIGETMEVEKVAHDTSFMSWSHWVIYGTAPTQEPVPGTKNVRLTFNAPGALYTAAGDNNVGDGRVFYRKLFVAE